MHSRRTSDDLKIVEDPDGQSPPRIKNHLGAKIEQLLLQDSKGRSYWAEQVEPGTVTTVQPTEQPEAWSRLKAILWENHNTEPEGFSYTRRRRGVSRRQRLYGRRAFSDSIPPSFSTSLMERNLHEALTGRGRARAPRRYVAVIKSSPEVAVGVPSARQEVNFHVLEGRW